jgi:hypothetical protein
MSRTACEAAVFVRTGSVVKGLHRLMVTSPYRQSSSLKAAQADCDRGDLLLACGPRYRRPSWPLSDRTPAAILLLVGGTLVKPCQLAGVWEEATFGTERYQQAGGPAPLPSHLGVR